MAEKREKLDQIIIRLKKTDSYDHPTLEILDKENMISDDIFDNSGTVYTWKIDEWTENPEPYMNPGFTSLFNCSFKCEVADNHFAFYNFQKQIPCN